MKEGWTYKKLGEVCDIYGRIGFRGYTTKDLVDSPEKGAISLSPSNILDGKMDYSKCTYISWFKYEESPEIKIFNGDILLVKTGSSYGKSALVENLPHEATINPQSVVLKNFRINSKFFAYQLRTNTIRKEFDKFVSGTAIPTFSQAKLSTVPIVFPPLDEQQRIVERLDSAFENIDKLKANAEKQLSEARTLFQKSLAKAMEPKEGWDNRNIEEVCNIVNGYAFPSLAFKQEGEVRAIKITNVGVGQFVEDAQFLSREYLSSAKEALVYESDIVVALTRTIINGGLKVAVVPSSYNGSLLNQRVAALRVKPQKIIMSFLYYFFQTKTAEDYVLKRVNTLMQPNLSIKDLRNMPLTLPPLAVQQRIVERLDSLSENVRKYEEIQRQMISECDALKQALLRKVFE